MKSQLVRKIFNKFYFKITEHYEEWIQGDSRIGRRRKIDVTVLSCSQKHIYWQEKNGNLKERFCDACFLNWILTTTEDHYKGKKRAEFWDKYLRKRVIGEDY